MSIGLYHFLGLAAALFSIGVIGVVTRRNAIGILIGVKLILDGVAYLAVAMAARAVGRAVAQA